MITRVAHLVIVDPRLAVSSAPPRNAVLKLSLADWLRTRKPPAPENLLARMLAEIEALGLSETDITPKSLSDAGASILGSLDRDGCTNRTSALDLLAADAFFTYAFEAAACSMADIDGASRYVLEKVTPG